MIRIVNGCVNCGKPCLLFSCPYRNMIVAECDSCGQSADLYEYEGRQLCGDCVLSNFKLIETEEYLKN